MKFTLEIEMGNAATLHYAMSETLKVIKSQTLLFEQTRSIQDANGNTVGKWEVVSD